MSTVWLPLVSGKPDSPTIRIGTQNLGFDEMERATSIAGDIASLYDTDVLAMQEVYRWPHRAENNKPDLMEVLRNGFSGWYLHEGPAETWMINVTASKFPIVKAVTHFIEDRHMLETTVRTPSGDITIFNFHAKRDGGGDKNACRHNRKALSIIRSVTDGKPFVLVGDLNATASRLWGECNAGAEGLLQKSIVGYDGSDFWAGLNKVNVLSVDRIGVPFGLIDAHQTTVATLKIKEMS